MPIKQIAEKLRGGSAPTPLRAIRSWMIGRLRYRLLGVPAASFFHLVGADEISRKISSLCGYIPPVVDIYVRGDRTRPSSFRMHSVRGLDQVVRTIWWGDWSAYERPLPDLFVAFSCESRFVLDIGAYSGFYSMIAASCPNVAKCYAFEPLPEVRVNLERNVGLNRMVDRIEVLPFAVCDQSGEADFFVPTTKTGLVESSSSLNARFHHQHLCAIKVPLVTIDEFIGQKGCHPVDLIKIDVESQEHRVLLGARRLLRVDRPVIFLEILREARCDMLEATREEFAYACGLLRPDGIVWQERVEYVLHQNDHVLCPAEKVDHFSKVVRSIGYRVM